VTALAGFVIADQLDPAMAAKARARLDDVSVVADCRAAITAGVRDRGVTALHDATEGGVLGGLLELAQACGHDVAIDRAKIPIAPETRAVCEALAIDPWWALSEGTLIATAHARDAEAVLGALDHAGIAAADVGEIVPGSGGLQVRGDDGRVERVTAPREDPWWGVWARLTAEGVPGTR
jgi:hydrogenase maturation factor